jgi:hypothetical protein
MDSILPARGTCEKNERGFCSSSRYGEKPLSVFKNSFSFSIISSGKRRAEQAKMVKMRKAVLFSGRRYSGPPLRW